MTIKPLSQEELAEYRKNPHLVITYANKLRAKMICEFLAEGISRFMPLCK